MKKIDPRREPFLLSDPLHDRIVRILLADGIVSREQVEAGWMRWLRTRRDGCEEPLWREILNTPGIDQNSIFEVVALAYAFRPIEINVRGTLILVDRLGRRVSDDQWNTLVEHLVLPVVEVGHEPGMAPRTAVATFDPTCDAVRAVIESLDIGPIEVRYATGEAIYAAIAEVLPQKKYLVDPRSLPRRPVDRGPRPPAAPYRHSGEANRAGSGAPWGRP